MSSSRTPSQRVRRTRGGADEYWRAGLAILLVAGGIFALGVSIGLGIGRSGPSSRSAVRPASAVTVTQRETVTETVASAAAAKTGAPAAKTGAPAPSPVSRAPRRELRYVVRPGDTLWQLAVDRYGDPRGIRRIKRRNGLRRGKIFVGQVLYLPPVARRR